MNVALFVQCWPGTWLRVDTQPVQPHHSSPPPKTAPCSPGQHPPPPGARKSLSSSWVFYHIHGPAIHLSAYDGQVRSRCPSPRSRLTKVCGFGPPEEDSCRRVCLIPPLRGEASAVPDGPVSEQCPGHVTHWVCVSRELAGAVRKGTIWVSPCPHAEGPVPKALRIGELSII